MSSFTSVGVLLDGLKAGWGAQYGPTLQEVGLEAIEDAAGLSESELKDLLQEPLKIAGAKPVHILRIVKSVVKAASSSSSNSSSSIATGRAQPTGLAATVTEVGILPVRRI